MDMNDIQPPRRDERLPFFAGPQRTVEGFVGFIRERGVAGFAIGFILGGAAQKLVQALMDDIINPLIGLFGGRAQNLSEYSINGFKVGDFALQLINFLVLCVVIYAIFKVFNLEKLDKPKE